MDAVPSTGTSAAAAADALPSGWRVAIEDLVTHVTLDGEGESDRVAWGRIRVLPDDQHAHGVERHGEGGEYPVAGGGEVPTGRPLGPEEVAEHGDAVRDRCEDLGPAGADEVVERHAP